MSDFNNINTFIFDVDGVLTDGSVISYSSNEHVRSFYIKDGYAIEKAILMGYHVIIISGGFEEGVKKRLQFLGVKHIFLGIKDKLKLLNQLKKELNLEIDSILYMGDDIPDLKILKIIGLPTCPADAANDVKPICNYISEYNGGRGAVRDVIEKTMKIQGKWLIEQW